MDTSIVNSINKKRYVSLDLLKILAISFVIFYHFGVYFVESWKCRYFFNTLLSTCSPLFFLVNGALLFNKDYDHKRHIKKCIKLFLFIIVFSSIVLLIEFPLIKYKSFGKFLSDVFLFEIPYNNHFWFLQQLLILYLLFPFLKLVFDRYKKYFFVMLLFAFVLMSVGWLSWSNGGGFVKAALYRYNILIEKYPFSIVYFSFGGLLEYLFRKPQTIKFLQKKKWCVFCSLFLAICIPLFMLLSYFFGQYYDIGDIVFGGYSSPVTLILTIILFLLFRINEPKGQSAFISAIANQTMFVYVFQMPVIVYWCRYLSLLSIRAFYGNILPAIIVIVFLFLLGYLLSRIKLVRWTFKL